MFSGDVKAISAAPGIGKKTAEKLILELKDKLKLEDALGHSQEADSVAEPALSCPDPSRTTRCSSCGSGLWKYRCPEGSAQVEITEDMQVEDVLKRALKLMMF